MCASVFMRDARTPRVMRAIYACACDDVGARGEIYKHGTHTYLHCRGDTFMFEELQMSIGRYLLALSLFLFLSLSLFLSYLIESSRFVFY